MAQQPPQANARPTVASVYKRAYKACESCRKNKAKCEVESSATSCTRCLREQKQCVFPAQRSAKRAKHSINQAQNTDSASITAHGQRRNQQSTKNDVTASETEPVQAKERLDSTWYPPDQDHTSALRSSSDTHPNTNQSLSEKRQPSFSSHNDDQPLRTPRQDGIDSHMAPDLQRDVLETFVTNSSDAIGLLFRAAERNSSDSSDDSVTSDTPRQDEHGGSVYSMPSPALASTETLSLWEQHRFVRQGWFTPREAVSYIEFFFQNLSRLSPVADSFYADHRNHKRLILEEPLLCCTLLMIASRHHNPIKGGGGRTRSDYVHNRVWKHIEHLIQRITFGSEKYSLAKTRTLGSIQALLLIIEWHPRALHFPPENDGWDASLAPSIDDSFQQNQISNSDASKRWREDVFEPAKRSDRMSWMLVGLATTLAHELGVFDHDEEHIISPEHLGMRQAKLRMRRLLFLYATQLSIRLGCTTVFPHNQNITFVPNPGAVPEEQASQEREILISRWIELTKLLSTATEMLFSSKIALTQMFKTSRYISLLEHFQPLLTRWLGDFQAIPGSSVSKVARQILLVEYHFVRMYINSIAVQALVERAASHNPKNTWLDHDLMHSEFSQDFRFVEEVRDSSVEILHIATKLSEDGILQYGPVRVFLRVVAASIYLLKTISLGSREADVARSLQQLEKCIKSLQINQADDIHLSSRYATLIARHVRRFKRNFRVKKASMHPAMMSRAASRGPEMTANIPSAHLQQNQQGHETGVLNHTDSSTDVGNFGTDDLTMPFNFHGNIMAEDWLVQPFNAQFAPFGMDDMQPASGLAIDSLDFLWNMRA